MIDLFRHKIQDKNVCLLGFGREGRSTYNYIREHWPDKQLTVADRDQNLFDNLPASIHEDPHLIFNTGGNYLNNIGDFDVIFKSPGITLHTLNGLIQHEKITSQTDLFLSAFSSQVIGVTGTKGKSTTSSLIHHIATKARNNVILVGNIGTPPLDLVHRVNAATLIVYELSSHQLELISKSPGVAIILNLLPEHLDRFADLKAYHNAKLNIAMKQDDTGLLIYNADDVHLEESLLNIGRNQGMYPYSLQKILDQGSYLDQDQIVCSLDHSRAVFALRDFKLQGEHNLMNLMAAVLACKLKNIANEDIMQGMSSFIGLKHRLEYIGKYGGIHFYNDSIATIPEATMEAVKAIKDVDTLILGGHDRMLDYQELISFLILSDIRNLICIGDAGKRIYEGLKSQDASQAVFLANDFEQVFEIIKKECNPDGICLLSPAAASYDMFNNFEERGDLFLKLARSI
ncbi:MAG: UDP-N-acetylmuramoyl-L-alanine--D-glutamate ligase [Bacteroidota bacterium]|nr:UDP-N-acetylmuramoyl-L-alanine--D-glutamate ligase [Bacteroidota bacterium]